MSGVRVSRRGVRTNRRPIYHVLRAPTAQEHGVYYNAMVICFDSVMIPRGPDMHKIPFVRVSSGLDLMIDLMIIRLIGAIAVPSVTRCRCRRRRWRRGHRCAGGVRQYSGDTW